MYVFGLDLSVAMMFASIPFWIATLIAMWIDSGIIGKFSSRFVAVPCCLGVALFLGGAFSVVASDPAFIEHEIATESETNVLESYKPVRLPAASLIEDENSAGYNASIICNVSDGTYSFFVESDDSSGVKLITLGEDGSNDARIRYVDDVSEVKVEIVQQIVKKTYQLPNRDGEFWTPSLYAEYDAKNRRTVEKPGNFLNYETSELIDLYVTDDSIIVS